MFRFLQTFYVYGAVGIALFAWSINAALGRSSWDWAPLWMAGALLAYNLDRWREDPADAVNVPERFQETARMRLAHGWVALGAAAFLILYPMALRAWTALGLVALGSMVPMGYSLPQNGKRLKDLAGLKTFIPPALVLAATLVPVCLDPTFQIKNHANWGSAIAILTAAALLLTNTIICDERDVVGDAQHGVRTLPLVLGARKTRLLLWVLVATGWFGIWRYSFELVRLGAADLKHAVQFGIIVSVPSGYAAALVYALRRPQSRSFYDWWVEGLLYMPAVSTALFYLWREFAY